MSHSHLQVHVTVLLSRGIEVQGDGSSSLRLGPSRFSGSLYGVLSALGSQRKMELSVLWGWSQAHWLHERYTGSVSGDLELQTLRKSFQSSVQKPGS